MLFNNNNCKRQINTQYLENNRNSEKAEETANSLRIAINYSDINIKAPHRHKGFNGINSPSPQGGFSSGNFFGEDGRSRQSKQGERVDLPPADTTNVRVGKVDMLLNGGGTPDPNPNFSISKCKYADCLSTNLVERLRPDTPHYAEIICCECGRHQKWLGNLEKQQQQRERIERLWFLRNRLNDWDKGFLDNIRQAKKLSPKQQAQLDRIEAEVGGAK